MFCRTPTDSAPHQMVRIYMNKKPYTMRLHVEPFARIKSGEKKIEIRLFDQKRKGLSEGDVVTFISRENLEDTFERTIKYINNFDTFTELFKKYPEEKLDMYQFYSKENEREFGVVAITLV